MKTDVPQESLFTEFPPSSKADWTKKAIADLKGADFDKKLVWKNNSGINVPPYFTREDQSVRLQNTGRIEDYPINYRRISADSAEKANAMAVQAVREGMTGVVFELSGNLDPTVLLRGLEPGAIAVSFVLNERAVDFVRTLDAHFKKNAIDPRRVEGFVDLGLWKQCLCDRDLKQELLDQQAEISNLLKAYPSFRSVHLSGLAFSNAGGSQAQEMAFTLSAIAELIEELGKRGLSAKETIEELHVTLGIGSEYFVEIAKFRAFQSLLHQLLAKYGVTSHKAAITGRTSKWSKSLTDAHTNLLRVTTEAMSAILGNASAVEIDPFDRELGSSSDFSRRIAGNIATILREESYFGKVSNPVDGSYYVEALSLQLASRALELFLAVEAKGGFLKQLRSGQLQEQIAKVLAEKVDQITSRRLSMVGVNRYPNLKENLTADDLERSGGANYRAGSSARRAGLEMEEVRVQTEQLTESHGKRPLVELCLFGDPAMRQARAAFAYDFLGVGAYDILPETTYEDAAKAAKGSANSDANIVVICSSDRDYEDAALQFVQQFRKIDPNKVLLLAGNPEALKRSLLDAGLDGFIHMRSNIRDTLLAINNKLHRNL